MSDVTASTKCWEGDYRHLLTADGVTEIFRGLGRTTRRQVVLNRIADRAAATAQAQALVESGAIDEFAWAEDHWPRLAQQLQVPQTWWGPAWPYSAPELTELAIARTPLVAHVAGDVRLEPGPPWLDRAVPALAGAAAVAPVSPSRIELVRPEARGAATGWVPNHDFSDQCFLVRPADLLRPEVVRATHPASGRYPKPGGALTFEARVGAWLRLSGGVRRIDVTRGYRHPVGGTEGSSYPGLAGPAEHLPPPPEPSADYPAPGTAAVTALVVVRNAVRTIGWTVASLRWCARVVVVDQASSDGTAARARAAGADVVAWPHVTVTGRAVVGEIAREVDGWLLLVDGDEVVPPAVAHALADSTHREEVDAVSVARRTFLLGRAAPPAPQWSDPTVRLLRADRGVYPWGVEAVRHQVTVAPDAVTVTLPTHLAVVKLAQPDLHGWLERMNSRTTLESRGVELHRNLSLVRAGKRFTLTLLRDGTIRAGRQGWRIAALEALARWALTAKAWENVAGGATAALAGYDEIAAEIVTGRAR